MNGPNQREYNSKQQFAEFAQASLESASKCRGILGNETYNGMAPLRHVPFLFPIPGTALTLRTNGTSLNTVL